MDDGKQGFDCSKLTIFTPRGDMPHRSTMARLFSTHGSPKVNTYKRTSENSKSKRLAINNVKHYVSVSRRTGGRKWLAAGQVVKHGRGKSETSQEDGWNRLV